MANTTDIINGESQRTTIDQSELDTNDRYQSFSWTSDRSVSEQVVEAVASVSDRSVTDIEPLNNAVDADALNSLFAAKLDGSMRRGGYLAFEYSNHFVTVFASGRIEVSTNS